MPLTHGILFFLTPIDKESVPKAGAVDPVGAVFEASFSADSILF